MSVLGGLTHFFLNFILSLFFWFLRFESGVDSAERALACPENGQKWAFAIENRAALTKKRRKLRKFKTALKAQERIKNIFSQFRDKAAR
jgi:hypothetical protein